MLLCLRREVTYGASFNSKLTVKLHYVNFVVDLETWVDILLYSFIIINLLVEVQQIHNKSK